MATATEGASDSGNRRWLKAQAPGWLRPGAIGLALCEALLLIAQAGLIALIIHRALVDGTPLAGYDELLAALLGVVLGRALIHGIRGTLAERASAGVRQRLREQLFRHLSLSDPSRSAPFQTGALAHQIVDRVDRLDPYYARFYPQQFSALLIPLLLVIAIAWVNWLAALVLAIAAPIIPLFMALIGLGAERLSRDQAIVTARLSGLFHDRLRGLSTIQRFGATDAVVSWLTEAASDYRERTMKVLRVAFLSSAVLEFFAAVAIASLAIYIGLSLLTFIDIGPSAQLTLASGLFILLLAPDYFLTLRQLAAHWHDRADALAAAGNLRPLLDHPVIQQHANSTGQQQPIPRELSIDCQNVTFHYPERVGPVNDLSLQVAAGERLLITGPSGSGKSTLLSLIAGLIRPDSGHIRYGKQSISDWNDLGLSRYRIWMNQRSVIFDQSLRYNLTLGRTEIDEARLLDTLELVGLGAILPTLDQGLETRLGDQGARLSGGQARRVCLARTLLEPRPLLLLDEPTEHLDADSERAVWRAIDTISHQLPMTTIVVSHRPLARDWADRIVSLDQQGRLREVGP